MRITEIVKSLQLPSTDFVLFGSGPMDIFGLRLAHDIDLYISEKLFKQLRCSNDWRTHKPSVRGLSKIVNGIEIEAFPEWNFTGFNPSFDEIYKRSILIDEIRVASLEDVLKTKKAMNRPKDIGDIKLIEKYLN